MATRYSYTQGIVLHTHRIGENHKGVTILTRDSGIISAVAHGAKKIKSRLRVSTESFCLSTVYLYNNPVNGTYKITDMIVMDFFEGIRRSIARYYIASLWAEIILKSYAEGSSSSQVYLLFRDSLNILEKIDEKKTQYVSYQFLLRFLRLSGHDPDPDVCDKCGRQIGKAENAFLSDYNFICRDCLENGKLSLAPGSRKYMIESWRKPIDQAMRFFLDKSSEAGLRNVLYALVERYLETKLNSIACAQGVL